MAQEQTVNIGEMTETELNALVGQLYMHRESLQMEMQQVSQNIEAIKARLLQLRQPDQKNFVVDVDGDKDEKDA